jgi:serine/threonine protein phosphatase 1
MLSSWVAKRESTETRRVPADTRVYAIGDIHGCVDRLDRLHDAIWEDASREPQRRRVVVYLGDYIDRGPSSRQVIDRLIGGPLPDFEVVHLMGNHERFLLEFLENPDIGQAWLHNGGEATLESYRVDLWNRDGRSHPMPWVRERLRAMMPPAHHSFFQNLRLSHAEGDYFFAHAGIRPGVELDRQNEADLLWIRNPFLRSKADHGKVVVHGHTPSSEPEVRVNRIAVDTGACYGGQLTALVLADDTYGFLHT